MSTCPEKDIHSLYVDGELPENFVKKYEDHIASCPKCRESLSRLKKIHQILQEDSASIKLDDEFLEKSYERLQSRMRFSKIVRASAPKNSSSAAFIFKWVPVAAAAAAVFALALPVRAGLSGANVQAASAPIEVSSKTITPVAGTGVLVEGGIEQVAFTHSGERPLEIKASDFETLKNAANEDGMTISVTKLNSLNAFQASNVSLTSFDAPDFLK